MEALSKEHEQLVLLNVDVVKWGSPVAQQFNIQSLPYLEIYGKDGKFRYKGQEAFDYLNKVAQKASAASHLKNGMRPQKHQF